MARLIFSFFAFAAVSVVASLGLSARADEPTVINGRKTNHFSQVLLLDFYVAGRTCTGTVVAPGTILTAAHCVCSNAHPVDERKTYLALAPFRANKIYFSDTLALPHPLHDCQADPRKTPDYSRHDLAFLFTDPAELEAITRSSIRVSTERPSKGAWATLVGYGPHEIVTDPFGKIDKAAMSKEPSIKRRGTARITRVNDIAITTSGASKHAFWTLQHEDAESSLDVSAWFGDSGGPLIDARSGRIIGVTSTLNEVTRVQRDPWGTRLPLYSNFAPLFTLENRAFLQAFIPTGP